jgi:beta-barrel assembly-enhancing protease
MRPATLAFFCVTLAAAQDRTLDKEAALGGQMAEEVRRSTTPVGSQEVQDYVARLGARLSTQLPNPPFPFTFAVVKMDQTNALHEPRALPGGYIFVPLSLLLVANDEAEFAGMLAQAMARGPLRMDNNAGTIPTIFVGGWGDDSMLIPARWLDRWREMELHADTSAAVAMSRAGFDPSALLRYIERLQPADRRYSALPPRASRIAALEQTIRDLPQAASAESGEFNRIQELARDAAPKPPPPTLRPDQ